MPNTKVKSRRKPSPNMILEAFQDHDLDPEQCFLIGDKKLICKLQKMLR